MKTGNVSVDILLSTYNWPEALENIFLSILRQTQLPDRVLIADDGSGYKTERLINRYKNIFDIPIEHVWQEDKGFRKTLILNKAMKFAGSDYIVQIDGDIILHPKFIEDHKRNAQRGSFVQGCRVILNEQNTRDLIEGKRHDFNLFSKGIKNRINATRLPLLSFLIKTNPYCSKNIKACNLAFWKDDFIAVNGYNNLIKGWGYEDDEFAARLINSGLKKRRLKLAAVCYHLNHRQHSRYNQSKNEAIYNETVQWRKVFSEYGLGQI